MPIDPPFPKADELVFGGDYNPEQWPESVWEEDVRLMREAHVNRVTVGVFSWSSIEPREGHYEFGWLDKVMNLMAENGIGVVLATPTASPPPWFSLAHPEALPVTANGVRLIHGSRDTYNPAAPAYRAAAKRVTAALAERYSSHPALTMWHLHNEYGTVSYGPETDRAFRGWLRARYGTLTQLNTTWNTAFWSQGYGEWEEIFAPRATQYLPNPSHLLDFKRFSADLLRDCLRDQVESVRGVRPDVPVTTNFMLPSWNHYDQWDLAAEIDDVSVDHYPDTPGIEGNVQVAFGSDLARSFNGGRPWVLMEQATTMVYNYAQGRILARDPGTLLFSTLQYLARGSTGSLFFQWRSPRAGAEFFHSPMVPHVGENSRTFREIVELGTTLSNLHELAQPPAAGRRVNQNRVAIVWDSAAWWSTDTSALPSTDIAFLPAVKSVHRALWLLGINVDFVRLDQDLSAYGLVLLPSKLAASDAEAEALRRYVADGGHTAIWYFSGSTDENLNVRPGGFSGAFADLLGIRVEEHFPQLAATALKLSDGSTADCWAEAVELAGATSIANFTEYPLAARPAVTQHTYGSGTAHYIATRLGEDALREHLHRILNDAGIQPDHPAAGYGIEAVRRHAGNSSYLFLLNHSAETVEVDVHGHDLLSDAPVDGPTTLPPGAALIVREVG
ncbi:beta-galactosidase [Arthrobacter tumbae]|uniref:beta-galactosidase n=1 Tax=Arthrobacter tumbae TaxID=163874 RepID=UPI00195A2B22|nr:beta-galactosidase [Arthrobacter tumbae]MBM7782308.1 beta-galactosidase [Arthrobacter tumbae]